MKLDSDLSVAMRITIAYVFLSVVAIVVNICSQALVLLCIDGLYSIPYSLAVGAATGLVTKYFLDKKYIFRIPNY